MDWPVMPFLSVAECLRINLNFAAAKTRPLTPVKGNKSPNVEAKRDSLSAHPELYKH